MKGFKGFNRNEDSMLSCRDFTYEIGKTYKHEGEVVLCQRGFHACHELHQTWQFYPNNGKNVFCEVECGGDIIESEDGDGKVVCSEITILKEVDMSGVAVFDDTYGFSEGYARVKKDGKYNHIGTDGKLLSTEWWDDAWRFYNGYAWVWKGNKCNHISTDGKLLSTEWWDFASDFRNGYAVVGKNSKWNHISTDSKLLSTEWWDNVWNFQEGYAVVRKGDKIYKIDTNGNVTEC